MAILIMGKYATSKLIIISYHKEVDLSMAFAKVLEKYFLNRLWEIKKQKKTAIAACVSHFDSGYR